MYEYEKQKLYNYLGEDLVDLFKDHKVYVAGGIITSLFCNRDINDIDVYFKNQNDMVNFYETIWGTNKWITFHTKKSSVIKMKDDKVVQLIHFSTFPTADDIFNKFDFTVCMGAFDFETEQFILHQDFLKHNSQRVLKFNKHTDFPLISVLRIHKYKEKGYEISRAETIKMLLTCANLNITNYDELFDQVSAMSEGENLEDMIDTSRPFDMMDIIEQIENYNGKDKKPARSLPFDDIDDLLMSITDKTYKPKYFRFNNRTFRILNEYNVVTANANNISEEYFVDANKLFKGFKFYKYVKKSDDKYYSFYDKNFEYKLREEVRPTNDLNGAIYCAVKNKKDGCTYRGDKDSVLIELEIDGVEDIKSFNSNLAQIQLKRCKFTKEVYGDVVKKDDSDDIPF